MHAANRTQIEHRPSRRYRVPALRFKRTIEYEEMQNPPPFTVTPKELRPGWRAIGRLLRALVNTVFMGLLILALLALIAAFAYQTIYHPEMLSTWANNLILTVQGIVSVLTST